MARLTRSAVLRGAVGAGAAGVLAACGAGERGATGGGVTKEPVRLQMYNHSGDQASLDQWKEVVGPFSQKHPNVTIDIGGPPGGPNTLLDSVLKMAAGGTPPDFTYSVTRNGPTMFTAG